jgi:hypothetical protein
LQKDSAFKCKHITKGLPNNGNAKTASTGKQQNEQNKQRLSNVNSAAQQICRTTAKTNTALPTTSDIYKLVKKRLSEQRKGPKIENGCTTAKKKRKRMDLHNNCKMKWIMPCPGISSRRAAPYIFCSTYLRVIMTAQSAFSPSGTPRPSRTTLSKSAAYTHFIAMRAECKTMPIDARVAMGKASMNVVCMAYKDNADAAIVDLTRQGRTCLLEHGLAVYEQVHSGQTVTHPWNRGHDVLEPADVPEKIVDISDIGWELNEVADASAVRMTRDAAKRKVIEDINNKLSDVSDGLLPPVVPGMATIQVAACSHTSAGLKCANFGTKMRYRSHKRKQYHEQGCNHWAAILDGRTNREGHALFGSRNNCARTVALVC